MTQYRFICHLLILICLCGVAKNSYAEKRIPETKTQITYSFAPIVKKASPSVVNIYTKKLVKRRVGRISPFFSFSNDPFFQEFFNRSLGGGFTKERLENSLGSGVILHQDGYVVTSAHVIDGADEITVVLHDGREFDARLVLEEKRTDLAVLKIMNDNKTFPALPLGDSEQLEVGDLVLAIGNPFGVGQTVTSGIVSANARAHLGISDMNYFIQTDAAINPGNSGGALIGLDGQLAGINTAIFSKSGGSLGIGFAIPASMVKTVLNAAVNDGIIRRPWFGAHTQNITSDMMESLKLETPKGALINHITKGSPADKIGLKTGDIITHINDKDVWDPVSLKFRIATLPLKDKASLRYMREGNEQTASFKPITAPEMPARDTTLLDGEHPLKGLVVSNINPALEEERGLTHIDSESDFVIITENKGATYANRLGLRKDDIILKINKSPVESVDDLKEILENSKKRWHFTIKRDNQVLTVSVL